MRLTAPDPGLLATLEQAAPGAVRSRVSDRLAMAHDASHFLQVPEAVVAPRGLAEVAALLPALARDGRHLTFRSGGTSLSGQGTTHGVLADTRRHFRRIEVLDDGERVRVQPGATIAAVNARLAPHRRKLGPDPASETACTVGGVVANNSSGMLCGTHANTYRTLESAVLVLADGTVLDTGAPDADGALRRVRPDLHEGLLALRRRVMDDPASLATIERLFAIKNTMGYGVNALVDFERPVDVLAHLVVGSEGTLAFVAEVTLRTVPVPPHVATGLLVFPTLADATGALPTLVDAGVVTCELLDRRSLEVGQTDDRAADLLRRIDVVGHAALLVEVQADEADDLAEQRARLEGLYDGLPLAAETRADAALSEDPAVRAALWRTRKGLYAVVAGNRPSGTSALLEDIAVPVPHLLETCEELQGLFEGHGYEGSVIFGHARDGNVHFLLNERFDDPDLVKRYAAFTEEMVELVLAQGGTLKAEHGTGRVMSAYVRRQYGDELYAVMRELKSLLDPHGVLNPGVVVDDDPEAHLRDLKTAPQVEDEVDRCVECGYCEPVCPSKDLTLTPRQRIVLRREQARAEAAGDDGTVAAIAEAYAYDGLETCAVDGMCSVACPVLIDTGDLVARLRAEEAGPVQQRAWTTAAGHWSTATRGASLGLSGARRVPALARAGSDAVRRVADHDTVPAWRDELPRGGSPRRARAAERPEAVYLPACLSSMFGPADGGLGAREAFLALCERAGVAVRVPEGIDDLCCGTPWKSKGLTDGLHRMGDLVRPVVEAAAQGGLPVVVDASSCTEGFATMLRGSGVEVVDATAWVAEHVLPRLPEARRVGRLAVHPTCSSRQLGLDPALTVLGEAVADEVVVPVAWGCCAYAGDRGLLHPELTASATAAEAIEVSALDADAHVSVNRTCELGMTRATGRTYRHVLELLEEATRP